MPDRLVTLRRVLLPHVQPEEELDYGEEYLRARGGQLDLRQVQATFEIPGKGK